MPRFVVLHHQTPPGALRPTHWDVMFECGDRLRTWACADLPRSSVSVQAVQLPDHRLAYLEYEGPVSGDRGSVTRWDAGQYRIVQQTADRWIVQVEGTQLCGRLELVLDESAQGSWTAVFTAVADDS